MPTGSIEDALCWIVDPIDGTREFISPESREFCTAICVLEAMQPVAALVVAHELGRNRAPLVFRANAEASRLTVNDDYIESRLGRPSSPPRCLSLTRSSGTTPPSYETAAESAGCRIKTRTTSQTLDLMRTALNLTPWTDSDLGGFDLFYRPNQKIWDGAPGILFNLIAGGVAVDGKGRQLTPFHLKQIREHDMIQPACVVGSRDCVEWFCRLLANEEPSQ